MTAGGVKQLRLCPFCGDGGAPAIMRSGAVCFVRCIVCRAEGPVERIDDNIRNDFHELSPEEQDAEWTRAQTQAAELAAIRWNNRAWEGNFWPEDLERMDEKMEQEADV